MKLKTWLIAVSAAGTLAAAPVMADQTMGGGAGDYPGAQAQTGEPGMMGGQDAMGSQEPMMGGEDMGAQDGMMGQEERTAGASEDIVRSVQEALNEQGKDVSVDGIEGPETSQALQEFQENEGLQASGQIDEDTLRALGLEDEAAEFAAAEEEGGIGAQPEEGMGAPETEGDVGVQPEGDTGGMDGGAGTGTGGGL